MIFLTRANDAFTWELTVLKKFEFTNLSNYSLFANNFQTFQSELSQRQGNNFSRPMTLDFYCKGHC